MIKYASKRRILVVGEGRETEYNYFVGFRNALQNELEATATSVSVARGKGGNASSIVDNAIQEKKKFDPIRKRGDRVFLLLDTEGAGRAPELPVAEKLATKNGIEIVYSCPSFEYWLLCHFPKAPRKYFKDCKSVIDELNKNNRWNSVCKSRYDKADYDIFSRLSHLVELARTQALEIDLHNLLSTGTALRVNPSTQVYELVALLIGVRTGEKCPIPGKWKLVGHADVTTELAKGDTMPTHQHDTAYWQI